MKCTDAEKMILLDDSGEIAPKNAGTLATHLKYCRACRHFQTLLIESKEGIETAVGPAEKVLQNIKREARRSVPGTKPSKVAYWKPALAMAASVLIGLGGFLRSTRPDTIGLEWVVTKSQLFDTAGQVADVLYSGLSDDDLAFNFLMTYEGDA